MLGTFVKVHILAPLFMCLASNQKPVRQRTLYHHLTPIHITSRPVWTLPNVVYVCMLTSRAGTIIWTGLSRVLKHSPAHSTTMAAVPDFLSAKEPLEALHASSVLCMWKPCVCVLLVPVISSHSDLGLKTFTKSDIAHTVHCFASISPSVSDIKSQSMFLE